MNLFPFNSAGDARKSADAALNNYQLITAYHSQWLAEAVAKGDTEKQAALMGIDYSPSLWLQFHFIHSCASHANRTRELLKTRTGTKEAPKQIAASEAIETLLDYLETMPDGAISALTDRMIAEIDKHDLEHDCENETTTLSLAA